MKNKPHRRIQDSIESNNPAHKMNLDRRIKNNERRDNNSSKRDSPARRFTVDRRVARDRRDKDGAEGF